MKLRVDINHHEAKGGTASPSFSLLVILIILIFMMMMLFSYTNPPKCASIC